MDFITMVFIILAVLVIMGVISYFYPDLLEPMFFFLSLFGGGGRKSGGAKNVKLSYFGLLGLLIGSLFLGGVINNNLLR